jgi:hypothetical protein
MYEEERAKHSQLQQKLAKSEESLKNGVLRCIALGCNPLRAVTRRHRFHNRHSTNTSGSSCARIGRAAHCTLGPAAVVCAAHRPSNRDRTRRSDPIGFGPI